MSASELELAQWRRHTAELYAAVRHRSPADAALACKEFRARRDEMFRTHPQSPLDGQARASFGGLRYRRFATAALPAGARIPAGAVLTLYWLRGYGGGLFLPFKDLTSGDATYGGGRYLYDTIKGADLGAGPEAITLDFNFAYNPSCAYSPRWICPLAPRENALPFAVEAGERAF